MCPPCSAAQGRPRWGRQGGAHRPKRLSHSSPTLAVWPAQRGTREPATASSSGCLPITGGKRGGKGFETGSARCEHNWTDGGTPKVRPRGGCREPQSRGPSPGTLQRCGLEDPWGSVCWEPRGDGGRRATQHLPNPGSDPKASGPLHSALFYCYISSLV